MRDDSVGFFWEDVQVKARRLASQQYDRAIPPTPDTGWLAPTDWPRLAGATLLGLDTETKDTALTTKGPGFRREGEEKAHIVGLAVGTPEGGRWYFPMRHTVAPEQNLDPDTVLAWARDNLCTPGQIKVGANLSYDVDALWSEGVPVTGPFIDVQHAEALLDSNRFTYNLDALATTYLQETKVSEDLKDWIVRAYGDDGSYRANIHRAPPCLVGPYAEGDVDLPLRIWAKQREKLESQNMMGLFDLETELIPMMVQMRQRGVRVDMEYARRLDDELTQGMAELDAKLQAVAGRPIDVDSRSDLVTLFDAAGVMYPKTAKGQASFVKEWLEQLAHPAGELIRQRRMLQKYRNTFVRAYVMDKNVNGRLYALFHQLKGDDNGAVSGRFSCVHENAKIVTGRGTVEAKSVVVGDKVWTHNGRWRPVTHLWRKGLDEMYDVAFTNGETLRCTAKHRVLTVDGWKTIGELNGYFKTMAGYPPEQSGCVRLIPGHVAPADNYADSCGVGHDLPNDKPCAEKYAGSRASGAGCSTLFGLERGREKPNDGQNFGAAPQLERRVQGRPRLPDNNDRNGAQICSPYCGREHAGYSGTAGELGATSYRRRQGEQSPGQPGDCDTQGSQDNPRARTTGVEAVGIRSINACGRFEVYDFTVADDESYLAHGVFSHNSSLPNLQNIPARDKYWGPKLRALFIPEDGEDWGRHDWSQIEYRFLAHYGRGPNAEAIRQRYAQDPTTDFHEMTLDFVAPELGWDVSTPAERKFRRGPVKNINFGLVYGMGEATLVRNLGVSKEAGARIIKGYHGAVPFVRLTYDIAQRRAADIGYITTIGGRRARFDLWEPKWGDRSSKALPHHLAVEEHGPKVVRAYTHKALNALLQGSAADLMKEAMRQIHRSKVASAINVPLLTCHDELGHSVPRTKAGREAINEVKHIMENCMKLKVPILADQSFGKNWGSCK